MRSRRYERNSRSVTHGSRPVGKGAGTNVRCSPSGVQLGMDRARTQKMRMQSARILRAVDHLVAESEKLLDQSQKLTANAAKLVRASASLVQPRRRKSAIATSAIGREQT